MVGLGRCLFVEAVITKSRSRRNWLQRCSLRLPRLGRLYRIGSRWSRLRLLVPGRHFFPPLLSECLQLSFGLWSGIVAGSPVGGAHCVNVLRNGGCEVGSDDGRCGCFVPEAFPNESPRKWRDGYRRKRSPISAIGQKHAVGGKFKKVMESSWSAIDHRHRPDDILVSRDCSRGQRGLGGF